MSIIAPRSDKFNEKEKQIAKLSLLDGMVNMLDHRLIELEKQWKETVAWRQLLIDSAAREKEKGT